MPEALELALPHLTLAALAWGPADGRPVLALHGWLDNAASFSGLAPLLCARHHLRIVSLDMPGHGGSGRKAGHYHFIDSVADVLAAADALEWPQMTLLGHSMGAGVSTLVAGTAPARVERCVLLEGLGPISEEPEQAVRRLARSLRVEARKREADKRIYPDVETAVDRLAEATRMSPASARVLVDRGLEAVEDGFRWRADPALRVDSRLRLSEAAVLAFLRAIRCPVWLLRARDGWPNLPELFAERVTAIANLQVVEVDGHHHVHLDEPQLVADALASAFVDP